jgi:hypothetical protein
MDLQQGPDPLRRGQQDIAHGGLVGAHGLQIDQGDHGGEIASGPMRDLREQRIACPLESHHLVLHQLAHSFGFPPPLLRLATCFLKLLARGGGLVVACHPSFLE